MTRQRVDFLLSGLMADANSSDSLAGQLAGWLVNRPEKIPELQPDGKFHRKVLIHVLGHPGMTPALRYRLSQHKHLLEYML